MLVNWWLDVNTSVYLRYLVVISGDGYWYVYKFKVFLSIKNIKLLLVSFMNVNSVGFFSVYNSESVPLVFNKSSENDNNQKISRRLQYLE